MFLNSLCKTIFSCVFFILLLSASAAFAQTSNISGIVNSYTPVTSVSICGIGVNDASAFTIGSRVMIIQMKGASIDTSNTAGFGDVISLNNCGNYEFGHVSMISGNTIFLISPLLRSYDVTGAVQLIKVPQYVNAAIIGPLTCPAWNGSSGGVIVIECSGVLTFNDNIDAKGKGFKGGNVSVQGAACPNSFDYYYDPASYFGAEKGEGIYDINALKKNGRGKLANGGGGGNNGNAGGAGGANFGGGGNGGYSAPNGSCVSSDIGGVGGHSLPYTNLLNKVFLGGGGGGGQEDNNQGTPGTSGGGIVILRANSIIGNGYAVNADAFDALPGTCDAAGGGGAGGSVLLDVPSFTGTLNINVKGGNGAVTTCYTEGASGGGGGGSVWSRTVLPVNVAFNVNNGIRGIHGTGSQDGLPGDTLSGLSIIGIVNTFVPLPIVMSANDSICLGGTAALTVSPNGAGYSYVWSPALSLSSAAVFNPSAAPHVPTVYSVILTNPSGCKTVDSTKISINPKPAAGFKYTKVCSGTPTPFTDSSATAFGTISSWAWDFGDGSIINNTQNPSHLYAAAGNYTVKLIAANSFGCADTITKSVKVYFKPAAGFTVAAVCFGDSSHFINTSSIDPSTSIASYLWTFGDASASGSLINPAHFYAASGSYSVKLITSSVDGCADTALSNTVVHPAPIAAAGSNSRVAIGSTLNLFTDTAAAIVWSGPLSYSSTQQNPAITNAQLNNSGTYQVIKTNIFGCRDTAETIVSIYQPEIPDNGIDDDGDGLIDCADPDLATLKQCYVCGYDSIAWKTVVPEPGFNKGIAVKFTGFDQNFTVPAGVTSIKIKAWGAGGGGGYTAYNAAAGAGGYTVDQFAVLPAETYVVVAGGGGWETRDVNQTARGTYGFGGSGNSMGAAATSETGSGGGLSGVFINSVTQTNARVIAGGGGGNADAGGYDETSGGNGNNPLAGGYLPLTGQSAAANSTGFGGGGGGYAGGISGIHRFSYCLHPGHSPDITADAGEGGSGFKYTSGGQIKFTSELNINPPEMTDVHYLTGVGVGNDYNMTVGAQGDIKTGGNGMVVIQWFEPIADLTITSSKDTICKGETLTLTASLQSNLLWSPAATLSSDTAKTVIAAPAGNITYQVISNYKNCKDTAVKTIIVKSAPAANFKNLNVCLNNTMHFTDSSMAVSGTLSSWAWDFGDGSLINNTQSPSHLYAVSGNYNVVLIVNNSLGCADTITKPAKVFNNPAAGFTHNDVCFGDTVHFINTSSVNLPAVIAGSLWIFGDGSGSSILTNPSHYYSSAGFNNVTLVSTTADGCSSVVNDSVKTFDRPVSAFTFSGSCFNDSSVFVNTSANPHTGSIASWSWNYGDGSPAVTGTWSPKHKYTASGNYTVTLITHSSMLGCADTVQTPVTIYKLPIAKFGFNNACLGQAVNFTDSSFIAAGNGSILSRSWNFGDGSALSSLINPSDTYAPAGTYSASLLVTTTNGCKDSISKSIAVHPIPHAEILSANVCKGGAAQFTDASTLTLPDTIRSWRWNFADNSTLNFSRNTSHIYSGSGTYQVQLFITSGFGCVDSVIQPLTVNPNPAVNFSTSDSIGCPPLCVTFQNTSSITPGTNISWVWNYGDGKPSENGPSTQHCYSNDSVFVSAVFDVSLTVTSDSGCIGTKTMPGHIQVYPSPKADFRADPPAAVITNALITLTNLSQGADYWHWNFGNGDSSILRYPVPSNYTDTGSYKIRLITSNSFGCMDTAVQTIVIEPDFVFYIPNSFSPNDDGINDSFTGKGMFVKEYKMMIFDRWGNLIFYTDDIKNPWDGKANHGSDTAQRDIYVYSIEVIDFKNEKHSYKGKVTLLR